MAEAGGSDLASQLGEDHGGESAAQLDEEDAKDAPGAEAVPERQSTAGASRSVASDGPPNGLGLRQRLMVPIKEDETAVQFADKVDRIATALEAIGDPVSQEDLSEIAGRGVYLAKIRELPPDTQVTWLTEQFAQTVTNDGISEHERTGKCRALVELLRGRGQHPSARQEKLFSTASNSPLQTPERLKALEERILTPKPQLSLNPKRKRAQPRSAALEQG